MSYNSRSGTKVYSSLSSVEDIMDEEGGKVDSRNVFVVVVVVGFGFSFSFSFSRRTCSSNSRCKPTVVSSFRTR